MSNTGVIFKTNIYIRTVTEKKDGSALSRSTSFYPKYFLLQFSSAKKER